MTEEQTAQPELSIIIPAYNESAVIVRNVSELTDWMDRNRPETSYEVVVVDDGSTDGMAEALEAHARSETRLKVLRHSRNRGRGRAIRTGFDNTQSPYVICLDADLSYGPEHIPPLLDPLLTDEADITLASAYHPDGSVSNVPWTRAVLSRWGNRVLSVGTHRRYHTVTCIVRGYQRHVLEEMELINEGKDLHLEIIQKATLFSYRIVEVPAHLKWRDRDRHKGKKKRSLLEYVPFLSMSATIVSHLVYNYLLRPSSILVIPIYLLLLIVLGGMATLLTVWLQKLFAVDEGFGIGAVFSTLRDTLLQGSLTLAIIGSALVILMIFVTFYFVSQQMKKSFDDMYILTSRLNARVKALEKKLKV